MPIEEATKQQIIEWTIKGDKDKTAYRSCKSVMLSIFKKYDLPVSANVLANEGVKETKSTYPLEEFLSGRLMHCGTWSYMMRTMLRWHHLESFLEIAARPELSKKYLVMPRDIELVWACRESGYAAESDAEIAAIIKYAKPENIKSISQIWPAYAFEYGYKDGMLSGFMTVSELIRAGVPATINFGRVKIGSAARQVVHFPVIINAIKTQIPLITVNGDIKDLVMYTLDETVKQRAEEAEIII